jgi:hypothetical protein
VGQNRSVPAVYRAPKLVAFLPRSVRPFVLSSISAKKAATRRSAAPGYCLKRAEHLSAAWRSLSHSTSVLRSAIITGSSGGKGGIGFGGGGSASSRPPPLPPEGPSEPTPHRCRCVAWAVRFLRPSSEEPSPQRLPHHWYISAGRRHSCPAAGWATLRRTTLRRMSHRRDHHRC